MKGHFHIQFHEKGYLVDHTEISVSYSDMPVLSILHFIFPSNTNRIMITYCKMTKITFHIEVFVKNDGNIILFSILPRNVKKIVIIWCNLCHNTFTNIAFEPCFSQWKNDNATCCDIKQHQT